MTAAEASPEAAVDPGPLALPREDDARPHDAAAPYPPALIAAPVDVRSASLAVLAVIATVGVLRWANAFFIPLVIGVICFYALGPLVDRLARWRIPRALGAAVVIAAILGGLGASVWSFTDDALALAESLPAAAKKMREAVKNRVSSSVSPIDNVERAAAEIQRAAEESQAPVGGARSGGVQRVVVEKPRFNLREYLWSGTLGLMSGIAQGVLVVFLTYFLLVSGDTYRRKLVHLSGQRLSKKKLTVQALDEIDTQIKGYLLVQLVVSAVGGVATGLAFALLGVQYAAVWGLAAAILNLVPFVGTALVLGGATLFAFLQFGTPEMALAVLATGLVINTIKGWVLAPWLTSRTARMNPVAVFVAVLAWGWLWGVWGLLLGVPVMMVIKSVCDRTEHLKPIGELLGE